MKNKIPKEMFFYETLKAWNQKVFSKMIPSDALQEEISIKNKRTEEQEHFWTFMHNKKKFIIKSKQYRTNKETLLREEYDVIEDFPIIITKTSKITHYGKVIHVINGFDSVKIGPERNHTVKEVIDTVFQLEHSEPDQFLLLKLIAFTSYVTRVNCRVCTEAGTGKDSVFNILNLLMNDVCTINPRSTAAAEYRLTNKVLVLNELSNLSADQVSIMQELILMIGDMSMSYNKSTRGSRSIGSFDTYDISKLSLVILYNNIEYYEAVGQEKKFFDNVFQGAVPDRFLPLKLTGRLLMDQFDCRPKVKTLLKNHTEDVKKIIKSLTWFRHNWNAYQEDKWENQVSTPLLKGRHQMHYSIIRRTVQAYSESQEEYNKIISTLNEAHENYSKRELRKIDEGTEADVEEINID